MQSTGRKMLADFPEKCGSTRKFTSPLVIKTLSILGDISMFWKKKKTTTTPRQKSILNAYLSVSMPLLSRNLSSPIARTGLQIFILGMTDKLRQAENLSMDHFIAIYEATLSEYELLPSIPVKIFINKVGKIASINADVAKTMRMGAQSIQMFVAEKDANAPTDIIGTVAFAEKNPSSFTELSGST
jgi:DNA/RNA endonuclease YhcR with UshA esterase domain